MLEIPGTLQVQYRNGRHGPFPDGLLLTEAGNFRVRDKLLETLEEGEYQGVFQVDAIDLYTYKWSGFGYPEVRTSIKAVIADYSFSGYDKDGGFDDVPVYSDPIEEDDEEDEEVAADADVPQPVQEIEPVAETSTSDTQSVMNELLKSDWTIGEPLKIDSTLPRATQRKIRALVKELGYNFDHTDQTWYGGES